MDLNSRVLVSHGISHSLHLLDSFPLRHGSKILPS